MIVLKTLNKSQLNLYIDSPEFKGQDFISISRHRAKSQIKNPRADENDILLILAYNDTKLVGYLGILPDYIFTSNSLKKIGWLSCIFIDNSQRGKRIAQKLIERSFQEWGNNILLTEFTEPAKRLYDKIGKFVSMPSSHGIRLYLRSDLQKILPPKHKIFSTLKPFLKIFDFSFNLIFDLRYIFLKKNINGNTLEYINSIDKEIMDFILPKQENELFKRGINELNWMIKNPWVISHKNKNCLSHKYHFSAIDKSFEFIPVKVRNEKKDLIAFMIFAKRNNDLKIPYCYYNDTKTITKIINYHLVKWKIKTASIYNTDIALALKSSKSPALFKKEINRNYLISNKFKDEFNNNEYKIQDGDGDTAFT